MIAIHWQDASAGLLDISSLQFLPNLRGANHPKLDFPVRNQAENVTKWLANDQWPAAGSKTVAHWQMQRKALHFIGYGESKYTEMLMFFSLFASKKRLNNAIMPQA